MLVLDTDHLRVLQVGGPRAEQLADRLSVQAAPVWTTVTSAHENVKGWQDELNRARRPAEQIAHYARLDRLLRFYSRWRVLSYDEAAAREFDRLKGLRFGRL